MHKMWKTWKWQIRKMWKCTIHDHDLPLRVKNTIPYRGRGTPYKPQNPKNAGPGGSENTKCRFYPFICHFGHFGVFLRMSLFLIIFSLFLFLSLLMIFIFCVLSLFVFLWFSDFCHFLSFCHFSWFTVFSLFFTVFQFLKGYGKDKALFWPLLPTIVHSHGKHLEGVNSLCEIWSLFFDCFLTFWLIFDHFYSILSDFSILPLRNHFFSLIFDIIFWSLFDHFYIF